MTERTVRPGKLETVKKLKEMFDSAKGLYFADFQGLNVAQATELRNKCREAGVDFMVVKNTMAQRALDESVREALGDTLTGPTAIATSTEDEVVPARVISDFFKVFEKPQLKAGLVDGRVVDKAQVLVLAELPGWEVLLGRFAGGLKSPVQKLHSALSSPLQKLAMALKQIAEQKD
jgi:large subunit ribosomal protein L10